MNVNENSLDNDDFIDHVDEIDDSDDNIDNIEWEDDEDFTNRIDNNKELSEEDFNTKRSNKGNKRNRPIRYSSADTNKAVIRYKNDLLTGCYLLYYQYNACINELLQSILLSELPIHLHEYNPNDRYTIQHANAIIFWFIGVYKVIPNDSVSIDEGSQGSNAEFLISNIITNKAGCLQQLNQLVVSLLLALGFPVRLITCIKPCSYNPSNHNDIRSSKLNDSSNSSSSSNSLSNRYNEIIIDSWIEIFDYKLSHAQWTIIHLSDHYSNKQTHNIKNQWKLKIHDNVYVLGIESDRYIVDLTKTYWLKYYFNYNLMNKLNLIAYWNELLTNLNNYNKLSNLFIDLIYNNKSYINLIIGYQAKSTIRSDEINELTKHSIKNIPEPKTFQEFKNHPIYTLERHLTSREVINPNHRQIIKIFKGENVYLTKYKEILKSKKEWIKCLRQVLLDQLDKPYRIKQIKSTNNNNSNGNIVIRLYGSWQTEPYEVPQIVNNTLPCNEYGNLEVWDGEIKLLPYGTSLITLPNAMKAAKLMNIPYVNALFGFENKNSIRIPKIGGIVVFSYHESIVIEATLNIIDNNNEINDKKRKQSIYNKWGKISRILLTRQRLKDKYGH